MADPMTRYAKIAFEERWRKYPDAIPWSRVVKDVHDIYKAVAAAVIAAWIEDGVSTVRTFEKALAKKPRVSRKET